MTSSEFERGQQEQDIEEDNMQNGKTEFLEMP